MPSFTRRVPKPRAAPAPTGPTPTVPPASAFPSPVGTRPSPSSPQRLVTCGIASLDDVLGGGLPLGSILTLLGPDAHTAWPRLVARHVAAQGLLDGGRVVVLGEGGKEWMKGVPWVDAKGGEESESEGEGVEEGRRIAWRYDSMGKFRTTVGRSSLAANVVLPAPTREALERDGRIVYLDPSGERGDASVDVALVAIAKVLDSPVSTGPGSSPTPASSFVTRIILPDVGGPEWPLSPTALRRLLLGLRSLIRPCPATAVVTLPPRLSSPTSPNSTWVASLAHLSDACLTLQGFGADPALAAAYAPAHGLLTPHALPNTHTLVAPAVRHSALLGLGGASAGENNLGFRLKRKRFVVETVHLGIEGGTGERRTAPVASATGPSQGVEGVDRALARASLEAKPKPANPADNTTTPPAPAQPSKPRAKRTVRFGADPELANGASIESTAAAHAKHTHAPGCGHDHVPEHVHWKSPMPSRQGSGEVPRVRAGSGSGARAVLPPSAGVGASASGNATTTSGNGETHISIDASAPSSSVSASAPTAPSPASAPPAPAPAPASASASKPIRHRSIHIGNPDSDGTSPAAHVGHHHAPGQGHEHANGDVHWKTVAPGAMGAVPAAPKSVGAELHERPELFDF